MTCKNPKCMARQGLPPHRVTEYGLVWFCVECRLLHYALGPKINELVTVNGQYVYIDENEKLKLAKP